MLWFSRNDLKIFFGDIIRNVAKEMNLSDWEWKLHSELLEQIKKHNPAVSQKLYEFFNAHEEWHKFLVKSRREEKTQLSPQEAQQKHDLIAAREASRNALLKELKK